MPTHILFHRGARVLAAALLLTTSGLTAAQTDYPARPVKIVVGFGAGTGPDIVARLLAQQLSTAWKGAAVIVENKAAAGGTVAAAEVARATPDGHTLLLAATGQLSIAPSTYRNLPYQPAKDFKPVSTVAESEFVLLVNPQKVPARNAAEFVHWSKDQKSFFMATFGAGTAGHFGAFILGDEIGVKPEPVHYRTTADAFSGLFGGDVQGVFSSVGLAAPQVKAQKLLAIGSTGATRSPTLPDVPTFKEQGFPKIGFTTWFGIVAPAGTPDALVRKLSNDIRQVMAQPETRTKVENAGFQPTGSTTEEFRQLIESDTKVWGKAVAATGFKAD